MSRRCAHGLVAALTLLSAACSSGEGKLERAQLSIAAHDRDGRYAQVGCQSLPLLQGSRSYERYVIDDLITMLVVAEPSVVAVRFEEGGLAIARALNIPRGTLLHGYAEEVPVLLQNGELYTVELSSECP